MRKPLSSTSAPGGAATRTTTLGPPRAVFATIDISGPGPTMLTECSITSHPEPVMSSRSTVPPGPATWIARWIDWQGIGSRRRVSNRRHPVKRTSNDPPRRTSQGQPRWPLRTRPHRRAALAIFDRLAGLRIAASALAASIVISSVRGVPGPRPKLLCRGDGAHAIGASSLTRPPSPLDVTGEAFGRSRLRMREAIAPANRHWSSSAWISSAA